MNTNAASRSAAEIARWEARIAKGGAESVEHCRNYLASLVLGRDFLESADDFFNRSGLTEFRDWFRARYARPSTW